MKVLKIVQHFEGLFYIIFSSSFQTVFKEMSLSRLRLKLNNTLHRVDTIQMKERKKELHFIQTKNMEGFLACEIKDILVLTLSKIFFC
jgi:hypothetical protein